MARRSKKRSKAIISAIILIILALMVLLDVNPEIINSICKIVGIQEIVPKTQEQKVEFSDNLKIYFIDVGQADSILITNKDESMLIDAGNNDDGEKVVSFIKDKGITKLNYVLGTHPHEDHIGGLDDVINNIDVENIYMPKQQTNTKTFEDVLDAIQNKGLTVTAPKKGDTFNVGNAVLEVMTDSILDDENLNLSSNIIKLTYGNNSFLFTGDAEAQNEQTRKWSQVDLLKVGHHGSKTSSSKKFLESISPKYSIIMVEKNNSYGLPKDEIVKRIEDVGSKIYRTDENGTIEVTSDGNEITIKTEKE